GAALILVVFVAALALLNKPRPHGVSGAAAEDLARQMLISVSATAWKNTGAVSFTFLGHHHLWDRKRGYDRFESGDRRVLVRIGSRTGRAWEHNIEIQGSRAEDLVVRAYSAWVNDSFWLNPVVKILDSGVTR